MCLQKLSTAIALQTEQQPKSADHYSDIPSKPSSILDPEAQKSKTVSRIPLFGFPSLTEIVKEGRSLWNLAFPIAMTYFIIWARSIASMLFLGHLGDLELAGGSLAIAFANITGYSLLSGLALGMEPLCSQAFGAKNPRLLSLTLHRTVIFLLVCSIPISLLWLNMAKILSLLGQDPNITELAHTYLLFSLPDLLTNSFVHPIRIYLRAQGITYPLTFATLAGTLFHLPVAFFLVSYLRLGLVGVSAASAACNLFVLITLVLYIRIKGLHEATWTNPSRECLTEWGPLLRLAIPSSVSVCLEWWWYEIMIVLCGLLVNPKATVASMGILIQTTSLIYIFPSSLGLAASTRVGNELGANRPKSAKLSATVAIYGAVIIGSAASLFAYLTRNVWALMFTNDVEILKLTSAALPILGLCELGNCPQTVGCGVVRGTARPSTAANINLGAFYLVGMPVAVALAFWTEVGFRGLWFGLLAAQMCCAGLMMFVVGSTNWEVEAGRAKVLTCAGAVDFTVSCGEDGGGKGSEREPLIIVTVSNADQ